MNSIDRIEYLRSVLSRSFPVRTFPLHVGRSMLTITTAEDIEQLIDRITETEFSRDERLPYWAEVWHSALALGEHIQGMESLFAGSDTLEIGCGLGVPGIVAAKMGAEVTFADYEDIALAAAELNHLQNDPQSAARFINMDFRGRPERRWPIILASDVIYERVQARPLAEFLVEALTDDGLLFLAEPNREIAEPFFEHMKTCGFRDEIEPRLATLYSRTVEISIHTMKMRPA